MVDKLDANLKEVDGVGVEDIDKRAEQVYSVSILVAMRWDKVMKATAVNCSSPTGIVAEDFDALVSEMNGLSIAPKQAN